MLASVVGVLLLAAVSQCSSPVGCSSTNNDGEYVCDFRVVSMPLAANQFTIQPQHITLEGVSGTIASNSFKDLANDASTFPIASDPTRIDIECIKDSSVVLSGNAFKGLSWLNILTFTNCDLAELPASVFQSIGVLDTLEFNYGSIDAIYPTSLQGLGIQKKSGLRGAEGRISFKLTTFLGGRIPDQLLSSMTGASKVEFIGCGISTLEFDVFSGMTSLGSVDLSGNDFTYLPLDIFDGLTSLGTVTVDGIPWDCSACGGTWFMQWAYNNFVTLEGNIVCASPNERQDLRMLTYLVDSCGGDLGSAGAFDDQAGSTIGNQFVSSQDSFALFMGVGVLALSIVNSVFIYKMKKGKSGRESGINRDEMQASSSSKPKKHSKIKLKQSKKKADSSKSDNVKLTRRGSGRITPSEVKINMWTEH